MKLLNNILRYFIIITISSALVANIFVCIDERNFTGVFSFRNLFLILFLMCFVIYRKWTLVLLVIINISFWYFYLTESLNIAYPDHPIVYYTRSINDLFGTTSKGLRGIILFLPLFANILISFIDIPYRIIKLKREIRN